MLPTNRGARRALQGDLYGTPPLYEIPFKYSANSLSKQLSQIDNTFPDRQYILGKKSFVSVKCSGIKSDQNVKLAGHSKFGPMTDFYFQL